MTGDNVLVMFSLKLSFRMAATTRISTSLAKKEILPHLTNIKPFVGVCLLKILPSLSQISFIKQMNCVRSMVDARGQPQALSIFLSQKFTCTHKPIPPKVVSKVEGQQKGMWLSVIYQSTDLGLF